jgi:Transposase, Mutator family
LRQAANGYCCFQRGEKAGALGFWQAIEEVWPQTRGQRCWVHKTANVLNKLPKSQQSKAKRALQEIWMAEPPSPGWRTFLRNHAPDIAAMDLFIAPTIGFDLLYVLVIVSIGAPKTCLDQRHTSSDRGMDCTPDHRGIPLVRSPALPDP